jgi:hypothetical protein
MSIMSIAKYEKIIPKQSSDKNLYFRHVAPRINAMAMIQSNYFVKYVSLVSYYIPLEQ